MKPIDPSSGQEYEVSTYDNGLFAKVSVFLHYTLNLNQIFVFFLLIVAN